MILIVDDNPDFRILLAQALALQDYAPLPFASGAEALAFLRESHALPRLVILDYIMAEMSGGDFIREVRRDPRLGALRVILTSGCSGLPSKAREAGADGYLCKPFDLEGLYQIVK